jgi:hypothetical protein
VRSRAKSACAHAATAIEMNGRWAERSANRPGADERDLLVALALINERDSLRAREETDYYLKAHPNGRCVAQLQRLNRPRCNDPFVHSIRYQNPI